MAYNQDILQAALRARSLTRVELCKRLGMEPANLDRELRRAPEPKQGLLNNIARELALPPFIFFMTKMPPLHEIIPDFRSETPNPSAKTRPTIESIQFAEGIQKAVAELGAPSAVKLPQFEATQPKEIEEFALRVRIFFDISPRDQIDAKDANAFYIICRKKIEDKGIFILHDSFPEGDGSGFCLANLTYPLIVVNTLRQTRGRRLFTLIHELGHILMGKSGISDPFISRNATERMCNRFAGSFLVPQTYVRALLKGVTPTSDPELDDVAWAARRLKISQQAAVLRLEQLGLFKTGSHDKWKNIIHDIGNPDFGEKRGGAGSAPPQEKVKLAKYGFRFASSFDYLLRSERVSEINLYRSTGLKPRYQQPYFDYANSLTTSELQTLELDDE